MRIKFVIVCLLLACFRHLVFSADYCATDLRSAYQSVVTNQAPSDYYKLDNSLANAVSGRTSLMEGTSPGAFSGVVDLFGNTGGAYSFHDNADVLTNSTDLVSGGGTASTNAAGYGSITLLFRALTGPPVARRYLLNQGNSASGSNALAIFMEASNSPAPAELRIQVGNLTNSILTSNNITYGAWYYLALTWSESQNEVAWYLGRVSGSLTSGTIAIGETAVVGNNGTVFIGNKDTQGNGFRTPGDGWMDEIAFFTYRLSPSQIEDQFNALRHGSPSSNFDLSRWNLMLPVYDTNTTPEPLVIETAQLNSGYEYVDTNSCQKKYFFTGADGELVFQTPWNGAVKSGGSPRSELRGTNPDGKENNWRPDAGGAHILEASCAVNAAGVGKVAIGQIHADSTNVPAVILHYETRESPPVIRITVKDHPTTDSTETTFDFPGVPLNGRIDYQLKIVGGSGVALLCVTVNGIQWSFDMYAKDSKWATNTLYFKAGCYYPNRQDGVTAQVSFYKLVQTHVPVHYVWSGSSSPTSPFNSWATAAHTIQVAIDAAARGDEVIVTNGVYSTGLTQAGGQTISNRVSVHTPMRLESVNGAAVTTIQGHQVSGTTNGESAVRCIYLTNGTVLNGFTLTGGATRATGDWTTWSTEQAGGGAWCASADVTINNCVFNGNSAFRVGGGACSVNFWSQAALNRCVFTNNYTTDNGSGGGGAGNCILNECFLINNWVPQGNGWSSWGGGAEYSTLNNCVLTGNSAFSGGAAEASVLNNCTLVGNSAEGWGGAVAGSDVYNCIIWGNSSGDGAFYANHWGCSVEYTCTTPEPDDGPGNITSDPRLVNQGAGDFRLLPDSPCIGAGSNGYAPGFFDFDGDARIVGGAVDMGAFEVSSPLFALDTPGHTYESGYRAQGYAMNRLPHTNITTLIGGTVEGQGYNPVGIGQRALVRTLSSADADVLPPNTCTCVPDEVILGIAGTNFVGVGGAKFTSGSPLHYPMAGKYPYGWTKYLCSGAQGEARSITPNSTAASDYVAVGLFAKSGGYGAFYQKLSDLTHTELTGFADSTITMANAVNESLVVAGGTARTTNSVFQTNAVIWTNILGSPQVVKLPQISGASTTDSSEALGINSAGTVVGYAYRSGIKRPCIWILSSGAYKAFELAAITSADAQANDIDENGRIVGTCGTALWDPRSCVWENSFLYDLNSRIRSYDTTNIPNDEDSRNFVLMTGAKINSSGLISGTFFNNAWYQARIFVLTPE